MASSYSTERIAHADHNYEAYLYLSSEENDKFLDWAATVAYYSANHYAKGKIFPYTELIDSKNQTFNSFEGYFNFKFKGRKISLHKVLVNLAFTELDNRAAAALKKLHDISDTARYHDYKLSDHGSKDQIKRDVQSKIDRVRDYCKS